MHLNVAFIETAWKKHDPLLVDYILQLSQQSDPKPDTPPRAEALTFEKFIQFTKSYEFRRKDEDEQKAYRIDTLSQLESESAEVPLPERLKLYKILFLLWNDNSAYARWVLIDVIRKVPLKYGLWRALKHIYKASEARNDYQLLGEIAARIDSEYSHDYTHATKAYMRRRAWRYLRKLGESLPACYPEAAAQFLTAYSANTHWENTWVANHIMFHNAKSYSMDSFYVYNRGNVIKNRAFSELWQRSPEPLLRLLETARSEEARRFASESLKHDFEVMLRSVEPQWVVKLTALPVNSEVLDNFIVWLLNNSASLEQQQFRALGLHEAVLSLLHSKSTTAQQYASEYVKAHVRDLPLDNLLQLAQLSNANIVKLVQQLITEHDPRTEVGLAAWSVLLQTQKHATFAEKVLLKHFGRKELTSEWFEQLILKATRQSYNFVSKHLLNIHPAKDLGVAFFQSITEQLWDSDEYYSTEFQDFALAQVAELDINQLSPDFVQKALLHSNTTYTIQSWLEDEALKMSHLPLDFYKALAYEPDWKGHSFIQTLKQSESRWAQDLSFDESLSEEVLTWLSDVRRFAPADLGFEWLMQLVNREEAQYHDFAIELMTKAFIPADFAPQDECAEAPASEPSLENVDKSIDLAGQSFLFTGKLKTMTRKEAQTTVTDANGKISSGVNGKLDYLVIGDEGSPMYGNGRKGSKQVKAESLNQDKDAGIKIISETAFLQMMAGEQREVSDDAQQAGCEQLWVMATEKPDTPISKFATRYLLHHHPEICLALTDRPVDPDAELPESFVSFEQFEPLFQHEHTPLREMALRFAEYEFARWQPNVKQLMRLCESSYEDVREFVQKALLDEPDADNKRYRIDTDQLEPAAVYSFCEAKHPATRQLGMHLIQANTAFQQPDALFQLTESPDRELRAMVVRTLWSLYRRYATTTHWQPALPVMASMGKQNQEKLKQAQENLGTGLPQRPKNLPATPTELKALLQRWLYELPPARLGHERIQTGLKPLSASKAKRALIETFRDVALDDEAFAAEILPLLTTFTGSRGTMEQAACLVAVTRIHKAYPQLAGVAA